METICEGPGCTSVVTQPKTGRRRRFCSAACRKAAYNARHNTIEWAPATPAGLAAESDPPDPRPDEAVAGAVVEARTLAGAFAHLARNARPQLAWRCEKTSTAINAALDDYFSRVGR